MAKDLHLSRFLLHSAQNIVDTSIELMRAESFCNESLPSWLLDMSQVNLSENSNGLDA